MADVQALQPDVVVVATGAVSFALPVPGADSDFVASSFDILSGKKPMGKKTVVLGGGRQGMLLAEYLAENGGEVVLVETTAPALGGDMGGVRQWVAAREDRAEPGHRDAAQYHRGADRRRRSRARRARARWRR